MAKEFVKGVTVGEATAEENTQPAVSTVETNEEETKQVIRANEEDFIAGLIAAADFASDEEETQRIEIVRNGKLAFAFSIRPLGSRCRRTQTVSSTSPQSSTRRLSQRIERSYGTTRRYGRRLKAKDFRLCPAWM